jgi:hypothetical protein
MGVAPIEIAATMVTITVRETARLVFIAVLDGLKWVD